ncbi:endoproteinase ArgC [Ramlibacter sp. AN1015]|uniref:endoproteinase ArgC n=1 Tax=Ramlibacter sp. AN1015 TaxID=3133428 RepID=UPI0030C54745
MNSLIRAACLGLLVSALAACGGGGDEPSDPGNARGSDASGPVIEGYDLAARAVPKSAAAPAATPAGVAATPVRLEALPEAARTAMAGRTPASGQRNPVRQIGQGRALAATADVQSTARLLNWQPAPSGGTAAAARFHSEGATALRLGLRVERLPDAATVRVFAPDGSDSVAFTGEQVRQTLERNAAAGFTGAVGRTFWLPPVGGPEAVLEIELPAGVAPQEVQVAVPQLSHLFVDLARGKDAFLKIGEAGTCNLDASCAPTLQEETRAVARMEFTGSDGGSYYCSGTLMADVPASGTPWFLSAEHCVSDQASASTLVTYWFYRSASCNSSLLSPLATRVFGGAELLYASGETDTSFMRLLRSPPAGVRFAGSLLVAPPVQGAVAGLHHPFGDLLKYSAGLMESYARCDGLRCEPQSSASGARFLRVRWQSGTTEFGSSGSALFAPLGGRQYVAGQLFAGLASCAADRRFEPDYYGRFDLAYRARLNEWLGTPPVAP